MLKVHIGLNLASQMKQLHWSYSNIILDKTEPWQEILCEIGLPLLHLLLFQISAHEYPQSRPKCLLLNKAMETTSLQATGGGGHGARWLGHSHRDGEMLLRDSPTRGPQLEPAQRMGPSTAAEPQQRDLQRNQHRVHVRNPRSPHRWDLLPGMSQAAGDGWWVMGDGSAPTGKRTTGHTETSLLRF